MCQDGTDVTEMQPWVFEGDTLDAVKPEVAAR